VSAVNGYAVRAHAGTLPTAGLAEPPCMRGRSVLVATHRAGGRRAISPEICRILRCAIVMASVALASTGWMWGLDPQKKIGQYGHDSWTSQRGLPGEAVYQILQTKDGYLWIRTGSGLARFDGVRFVQMDAEIGSEPVKAICMSADGDLLIRTATQTVIYKDRQFTDYLPRAPLPGGAIRVLFESREHVVFIGSDDFIYRLEKSGKATMLRNKTGWIFSFVEDHNGAIWIAASNALFTFKDGKLSGPLDTLAQSSTVTSVIEDRQQRLWAGAAKGLFRLDGNGSAIRLKMQPAVPALATAVLQDGQGNIWVGTQTSGLVRQTNNSVSTFDYIAGLTDDSVLSLLEDREGSLWIGTASGLDRLRDTSLTTFTTREGLPTNLAKSAIAMRDGSLTAFTDSGGLARISGNTVTGFKQNSRLTSLSGQAIFESRDGSLWIGTLKGLSRIKNGSLTVYPGFQKTTRASSSPTRSRGSFDSRMERRSRLPFGARRRPLHKVSTIRSPSVVGQMERFGLGQATGSSRFLRLEMTREAGNRKLSSM